MTGARSARFAAVMVMTLLVLAGGPAARRVDAAAYDRFYANFQGEELMRAINADRAALGLHALAADPTLAAVARDRALTCPSNSSLVIRGRARDMADRNYLGHDIAGCSDAQGGTFSTFDFLGAFGFTWTSAGENIGSNNYPSSKADYATGCDIGGGSCSGSIQLPWAVAANERGWMSSSGHRAALLSTTFDRYGCAAWDGASDRHVYSCYFLAGGNASIDTSGPGFSGLSGVNATYAVGSTPTFTATASDGHSLLAEGRASIDGAVVRSWAHDHDGATKGLSAVAPPLAAGTHTFTWWERDTSTNARSITFQFSAGGGTATPRPTPTAGTPATPRPSATSSPAQTAHATLKPPPLASAGPASTPPPPPAAGDAGESPATYPSAIEAPGIPAPAATVVVAALAVGADPPGTQARAPHQSKALAGRDTGGGDWLPAAIATISLLAVGLLLGRRVRFAGSSAVDRQGSGGPG